MLSVIIQSEKASYYMSPTVWHSGKYRTREKVRGSVIVHGCKWVGHTVEVRWTNRSSLGELKLSVWYHNSEEMMLCTWQNHKTISHKKSNVNCGLQLLIMYQYWIITCNKWSPPVQDVNKRGCCELGEREHIVTLCTFCKLVTVLRNRVY